MVVKVGFFILGGNFFRSWFRLGFLMFFEEKYKKGSLEMRLFFGGI